MKRLNAKSEYIKIICFFTLSTLGFPDLVFGNITYIDELRSAPVSTQQENTCNPTLKAAECRNTLDACKRRFTQMGFKPKKELLKDCRNHLQCKNQLRTGFMKCLQGAGLGIKGIVDFGFTIVQNGSEFIQGITFQKMAKEMEEEYLRLKPYSEGIKASVGLRT